MCKEAHTQTVFFSFFVFHHTLKHVGSQFPNQESDPRPLHWKHRVLTTGLPGKAHIHISTLSLSFFCILKFDSLLREPHSRKLPQKQVRVQEPKLELFSQSCMTYNGRKRIPSSFGMRWVSLPSELQVTFGFNNWWLNHIFFFSFFLLLKFYKEKTKIGKRDIHLKPGSGLSMLYKLLH